MADLTRIQFKRSKTPNVRPAPDTVAEGEIILNLADRAILTKLGNEIIDLGFAKGGKVDGNIDLNGNFDQKNGHFNTTGNITVGGTTTTKALSVGNSEYSGIDIRQHTNRYLRLENTPHGAANFAILWKRDADDSNLSSFQFPSGHGIGATQQWVNKMVYSNGFSTIVKNPNDTDRLCLATNNSGEAGAYDYANDRWAFVHNQTGMSIYGPTTITSVSDYTNIKLKKADGRYVQIETKPHAGSADMLAFAYKQADGTNQHVMTLPYDSGTIASREWTNLRFRRDSDGVVITPLDQNEAGWWQHIKTGFIQFNNGNQQRMKLTDSQTDINTMLGVKSTFAGADQSRVEVISPDARHAIGMYTYNDGRNLISAKNTSGSWTNIRISDAGFDIPVSLRLTGGDYAGLQMMRSDGTYTRIEQNPISSAFLLTFIGRTASGSNQHVLSMPRETGTLATQSWVNSQGFQKGSSNKQWARGLRTLSGIGSNTWGTSTRGIQFAENLNNRIVVLDDAINGSAVLMGSNIRTRLINSYTKDLWAWIDGDYIKYSWEAGTNRPADVKVTIMEFY